MSSTKTLSVFLKLNSAAFTGSLKKVEGKLGKFSKKLGSIGSSLTTSLTMPLLGVGAMAIKTAAEFETSMTKIQTLVGTSAAEVDILKNSVLELAGKTATAPKDLADGLFFIQSAGFKGAESIEVLEVAAKSAAMGMGEMQDISNALTSVMTGYADSNMTAAQAGDLLHETLKQGKFEASEFMGKLGSVIPTAAAFGISFEQLGASVATMSKLSGDAAGSLTAVNRLMLSLNAPAEQQSDILNKVFGSYDNLSKSLKSDFNGTLNTIFSAINKIGIKVFLAGDKYFTPKTRGLYNVKGNNLFINKKYLDNSQLIVEVIRHEGWHAVQDCMAGSITNNMTAIVWPKGKIPDWIMEGAKNDYADAPISIPYEAEARWAAHSNYETADGLKTCADPSIKIWERYPPIRSTEEWLMKNGYLR